MAVLAFEAGGQGDSGDLALQKLLDPLFPGLMGVRLTELAPDRVVAEMPVRPDLCTAGGILHGGAYMAFADTLGAVGTLLNLAPGKRTTTTDSSEGSSESTQHRIPLAIHL